MTGYEWLAAAQFGAVFGAIGQLVRMIGGLKKMNTASAPGEVAKAEFSAARLITSVAIGGVAGALAAVSLEVKLATPIDFSVVLGLMGAGYAGADFIEAFMNRRGGSFPPPQPPPPSAAVTESAPSSPPGQKVNPEVFG